MDNKNLEMELERLSKSEYAMPKPNDDEEERRKESDSKKKRNMRIVMTVSLLCIVVSVLIGELGCFYTGFNNKVTSENIGDYLGLFATHCSVVFLTTSLMTMLSEKSKFVYHIDLVQLVLINPPYYNFLALAMYAMESIFLAIVGFLIKRGSLIIGGFLFGIVAIVFLFKRMISVYYRKEYHKNKVEDFLKETIKIVRKIEDKKEVEKYKKPMEKIGYKRQFEAIINQAVVELKNNNVSFTIESVALLEKCIMWHVGTTYENKKDEIETAFEIINSDIGLARKYHPKTKVYLEILYKNFAVEIAKNCPEDLNRYYNDAFNSPSSEYLKMVRSTVFPYILNSYIANGDKQKFFTCLTKWDKINGFFPAIRRYLVSIALDGKEEYLAEYYDMLKFSAAKKLEKAKDSNRRNSVSTYNIPYDGNIGKILNKHEIILEDIYNESVEIFENILSYKNNRKNFMDVFPVNGKDFVCWKNSLEKCIWLSESALSGKEPEFFITIFQRWNVMMLCREKIELVDNLRFIVDRIVSLDDFTVKKTNEDVEFLLEYIGKGIIDSNFKASVLSQYMYNIMEREHIEDIRMDKEDYVCNLENHFLKLLKVYIKILKENIEYFEMRKPYCSDEGEARDIAARIEILQNLLDKAQAEKGEINGTKINKSE